MGYTILSQTPLPREQQAPWDWNTRSSTKPLVIAEHGTVGWLSGEQTILDTTYMGPERFSQDHVIPRSLGGASTVENLRPETVQTNSNRSNKCDVLVERHIGFKQDENGFLVPDKRMRLVKDSKGRLYNVPKFSTQRIAGAGAAAAGFAVAWDLVAQGTEQYGEHGFDISEYDFDLARAGKEALIGGVAGMATMAFNTAMGIYLPGAQGLVVVAGNTVVGLLSRQGTRSAITRRIDTKALVKDGAQASVVGASTFILAASLSIPPAWIGVGITATGLGVAAIKRRKIRKKQKRWNSVGSFFPQYPDTQKWGGGVALA